jgi:CMP-N,N'-diacetyllegionaminic acid synthase
MLDGTKLIAVIPVRGGSKGIPRKNLYRLGRHTLLERAILLALACPYIDQVIVSTDDKEMFDLARKYFVAAPTLRPAHLATDSAKSVDVVLDLMSQLAISDAYILLLQVTSPLRTLADLNGFLETFASSPKHPEAIVSVTAHDDPHPDKIQKIENGLVRSYLGVDSMVPRQSLPKVYRLNGAFYMTHAQTLRTKHTFLPERTIPYVMPRERSVNLDTIMDLHLLEALLAKNVVQLEEIDTDVAKNSRKGTIQSS